MDCTQTAVPTKPKSALLTSSIFFDRLLFGVAFWLARGQEKQIMKEAQRPEEDRDFAPKTSLEIITRAALSILPMIYHISLYEDPNHPGTGLVQGWVIGSRGEKTSLPLGVIAPDGKPYSVLFRELSGLDSDP